MKKLINSQTTKMCVILTVFLITASAAFADYVCTPIPITPIPHVEDTYPYGQPFKINVEITGVQYGTTIGGIIKDTNGLVVQDISSGTWITQTTVEFNFQAINKAGDYKFNAYLNRPIQPYDKILSEIKPFTIKAPLQVTFTIKDLNQYTSKDIELLVSITTPGGGTIDAIKTLTGTIDNNPVSLNPQWVDSGAGTFKAIIQGGTVTQAGTMNVKLIVSDPKSQFEPITKEIKGINIMRPTVTVSIQAPTSIDVNKYSQIKVTTADVGNIPMDVETLQVSIRNPSGVEEKFSMSATENDFTKVSTGVYGLDYQFESGGSYSFHAVATKENLGSGSNLYDPITVVRGGIIVSCDVTIGICDSNCPDDPDCQTNILSNIPWTWILIGGGVIVIVFLLRKKK